MPDPAQLLIGGIGVVASGITFLLMFFHSTRRAEYRSACGFSLASSLLGALLILLIFLTMAYAQGRHP